jgi:hypothetical protein
VQDNFVAQWGDLDKTRPTEDAMRKLPDEESCLGKSLPLVKLPDTDGSAETAGSTVPGGHRRKPSGRSG